MKKNWLLIITGLLLSIFMAGCTNTSSSAPLDNISEEKIETTIENKDNEKEILAEQDDQAKKQLEELEKEKEQEELAQRFHLEVAIVSRIVDGDTVELTDNRKIRLVGVNTPESTSRIEEYGKEASKYTQSQLEGRQVWLQKDVSDTDRYDRLLRIIWVDIPTDDMDESEIREKMFNADLVINGFAEPSTYTPDVKYSDYFIKFAREARENNTGLWAFGENGTTKGDLDGKKEASKINSTSTEQDYDSSSNEVGVESFKNCTELKKIYPNGVGSDHPAYASKHDRDKDGWACES
ncbi:thermonuclease family protein [Cytobacillus sp. IB215316]|uniref:thermonuclease family protein n=1 Tax=Cytobacillus sp. IB215316 TaxID=3097354 RepID=UPI002A11CECB|nr:thermonuclease family protein [Cytobacillus sp. IB215316]MDX8360372.1 thermonuclease family protein [Cytobacillus sp. IB215316]